MQAQVVHPLELGSRELERWREFQRRDAGLHHPFLAAEFALAVGEARDDARVAVIEDAGELVAFLPFQATGEGAGEPIGHGIGDAQALVAREGWSADPRLLLRAIGLRVWRFDHLLAHQRQFEPFHERRLRAPAIDLSAGLELYLSDVRARSRTFLTHTRRHRRKLAREVGEVEVEWRATDPEALSELIGWKTGQYRATDTWDRFAHPWIRQVVERLAATSDPWFEGRLTTLRAGGRLAAAHFGLRCCGVLSYWFPAYDPELADYSPGRILLLAMAEQGAGEGLHRIDLGKGEHGYKLRVANAGSIVAEGAAVAGERARAPKSG